VLTAGASASAATLLTVDEALKQAFPGARIERQTAFLTAEQLDQVADLSGVDGQRALVTRYVALEGGDLRGYAYVDTHRVRTLPETVVVILDPAGEVRRVEVVAFREPMDYLPPERWYGQFESRSLSQELALKRGIRPITGATLTARATTDAVRRVLSVHQVLVSKSAAP